MNPDAPLDTCFAGRRVLITGGLGFVGSNLGRRLVGAGAEVCLVDSLIPGHGGNLFNVQDYAERARIEIGDVRDGLRLRQWVEGRDFVFHLAGQSSHLDSMTDPFMDLELNCRASLGLLEACREFNPTVRIVFASTRQVYGRPDYLPVDERHAIRPVDINGIHKVAREQYHLLFHAVYGLHTCVLRLTNTYGPGMRIKDGRQTFLGFWIGCVLEGKPIEVWGGGQRRDLTFVEDAVDAMLLAACRQEAAGRVFNLGAREVVTLGELAERLVKVNGGGTILRGEFPPERKRIDIGDYYADFSLISGALGWEPRVGLDEGLERTLRFYRLNLPQYR